MFLGKIRIYVVGTEEGWQALTGSRAPHVGLEGSRDENAAGFSREDPAAVYLLCVRV